jgi:hypothetical protein
MYLDKGTLDLANANLRDLASLSTVNTNRVDLPIYV